MFLELVNGISHIKSISLSVYLSLSLLLSLSLCRFHKLHICVIQNYPNLNLTDLLQLISQLVHSNNEQ